MAAITHLRFFLQLCESLVRTRLRRSRSKQREHEQRRQRNRAESHRVRGRMSRLGSLKAGISIANISTTIVDESTCATTFHTFHRHHHPYQTTNNLHAHFTRHALAVGGAGMRTTMQRLQAPKPHLGSSTGCGSQQAGPRCRPSLARRSRKVRAIVKPEEVRGGDRSVANWQEPAVTY